MSRLSREQAAQLVSDANAGVHGEPGRQLVGLLAGAGRRGKDAEAAAQALLREANALAWVVADLLDGKPISVVDDLPHDVRRRVIACRHRGMPFIGSLAKPSDQFGPLPEVPPRASVMRARERVVEHEARVIEHELPATEPGV